MISAFVVATAAPGETDVAADLRTAGIRVVGHGTPDDMVAAVIRGGADLVICWDDHPGEALFDVTRMLEASSPRPTVLFTTDPDAEKMEQGMRAGIHAYVVNGYAAARLRAVVHVAQARFRQLQALRGALEDVNNRFAERKLVDRAKGILMRLRDLGEEDAYAALRSAAMKSKRRLGQVAQQVIEAARYGEAVNRAGQMRMVSQRLVTLHALLALDGSLAGPRALLPQVIAQADANLLALGRILSQATFGDLVEAVTEPWAALKAASAAAPSAPAALAALDGLAERLLGQAEQLTANLENAGFAAALRLINVSGRQRMLSQRLAKQVLLAGLLPEARAPRPAAVAATADAYAQAMTYLRAVPLSTPAITAELRRADEAWTALLTEAAAPPAPARARAVFAASEALLACFETLTADYERNLQSLMS